MFKNILVPVTPSSRCEQAADAAIGFAQRFESKLVLLHVHGFEHRWGEAELLDRAGDLEAIKSSIEEQYREKLKGVDNHRIIVTQGVPHVEILRISREMDSDLIVMCPYSKDTVDREYLMWTRVGSTMEQVSRQAQCPVMIVTRPTPYGEHVFRDILVATDFSKQAGFVVKYASQMARHYGSDLTVLNVLDTDGLAKKMSQEEIVQEIGERMDRMEADYGEYLKGITASSYECWEGQPATEILKLARVNNSDVILMAHHSSENDPEKALLGSTLAQVATKSLRPVMSINHAFEMRGGDK